MTDILLSILLAFLVILLALWIDNKYESDRIEPLLDYDYIVEDQREGNHNKNFICFYKKQVEKYRDNKIKYYYCINKRFIKDK